MRRGFSAVAAAGALCVAGGTASADSLDSLYGAEITETGHAVRITLEDGAARFRVRRTLENVGVLDDEAQLGIELPSGGVVTGLRVRGAAGWRNAELLPEERAQSIYDELTNIGLLGQGPLTSDAPALMAWAGSGNATLRLFPVRGGESTTIEYTVTAPTCYAEGAVLLDYPTAQAASNLAAPTLSFAPGVRAPRVFASAGASRAPGADSEFAARCGEGTHEASGTSAIAIEPGHIDRAAIRYAAYRAGAGKVLARVEIDAAAVLEPAPVDARVVFVVDGSWSADDSGLDDQLALVRGYVANAPDARVEVVVFRRRAARLFGGFVDPSRLDAAIAAVPASRRALGNGSNLDDGLALAANLLAGQRRPARVVVVTDGRMRTEFVPDQVVGALRGAPAHTVVHVVDRERCSGALYELREDGSELAPIAAAFGGMAVTIGGSTEDPGVVAQVMLGLVRPIRIDDFEVHGAELADVTSLVPDVLAEGVGVRAMALAPGAPEQVRVTGKIWGRTFERVVARDRGATRTLATFLFGHAAMAELSDDQVRGAAVLVGAVSPQTSYLAADLHRRPRVSDPEVYAILGGSGHGVCGGCSGSSISCSSCGGCGGVHRAGIDDTPYEAWLAGWLRGPALLCARAQGLSEIAAGVTVETTGDEVVAVTVDGVSEPALAACVADAAWDLRLTAEFDRHAHRAYRAHVYAAQMPGASALASPTQ